MNVLVSNIRAVWVAHWLSAKDTARVVFLNADPMTIRVVLAWASFVASLSLWIDDDKFVAAPYRVMALFGTEHLWAVYFLIHFLGVHWRMFERARSRPRWAFAVNLWGFCVWFVATAAIVVQQHSLGVHTSMSLVLCVASAWALFLTGIRKDLVTW